MVSMTKTPMPDLQKTAKLSLAKHGLEADGKGGIKVRLVLDHSGSMQHWYSAGAVQRLTEQVLGLASALDDDGTIEVWFFGSGVSRMYEVSLTPTAVQTRTGRSTWGRRPTAVQLNPHYVGWVDRAHRLEPWGLTNYPAGMKAAIDFAKTEGDDVPSLVIFQTDGAPDDKRAASEYLRSVSGEDTFFAFVVFGEEEVSDRPTPAGEYMRSLDRLTGRTRDNASAFFTGGLDSFATLPDSVVYDGVLKEFVGQWLPQVL